MLFLLNMGVASAGIGTLHPGAGKNPPKTPEWKIKQQEKSATMADKDKPSVVRLDSDKRTAATMLNVMLGESLASAVVSAEGDYQILDGNAGKSLLKMSEGSDAKLTISGNALHINGQKVGSSIITLKPNSSSARVLYNDVAYRGTLRIIYDGSSIKVINNVSLEDYTKGVLPSEMSPSWNKEALKAQAVAARTFALYSKSRQHSASSGYELCGSSHCQVYSGSGGETDATNQAVDATYGQVMYYNNQIIYAAFHASSGGATENSENVWGSYMPYLRSVTDDDSKSPYHNWTARFTVAQVEKKLASSGKGVGTLQSLAMVPVSSGDSVTGRSSSGRAYGIKFTGSSGNITFTGEQARSTFGLKSAMFNIRTERTAASTAAASKSTSKSKVVDAAPDAMSNTTMKLQGVDSIVFEGHGFGHGLGMAQYGANAMAAAGSTYDQILHHYYTDVVIQEIY